MKLKKYFWELIRILIRGKMIVFYPTLRCNLKCPYCALTLIDGNKPEYPEIDVNGWKQIIDKEKPSVILISGGEPGLYSGLSNIINYAVKCKCLIRILTNLTEIDEFVKINYTWRVIFTATYHEIGSLVRFIRNYNILKKRFHITIRELIPKNAKLKPVYFYNARPAYIENEINELRSKRYTPDGTIYNSCEEMIRKKNLY